MQCHTPPLILLGALASAKSEVRKQGKGLLAVVAEKYVPASVPRETRRKEGKGERWAGVVGNMPVHVYYGVCGS